MVVLIGAAMAVSMLAAAGMAWAQETAELPADPSGLTAMAVSDGRIDLSWTDNAVNETAYVVERSPDGSTGWAGLTSSLPADTTSYSDTGLSGGTTYYYRVKATNASGGSDYSNTASATTNVPAPTAPTLNPTPDQTWMTNGTVYSIIRYGNYIYVGGKFTKARSAATGGQAFAATNIARFNADTGMGDPTWTPDVTGADMAATKVNALAAAGGKIWIGGKFEAVDGLAQRNLAAVSSDTGVVDPSVDPLVGPETSGINAIVASSTKVYVGGAFSKIDGKSRAKLAALDFSGNLDLTWKPKTDRPVRTLAFSCDGATVFAGGKIRSAAGSDGVYSPRPSIARFDATSGALHPWAVPTGIIKNDDEVAADLAVTCERITTGYLGPNFTRSFRLDDGNTGTLAWEIKSGGDVQTVAMLSAEKVVIGGHFGQVDGEQRTRIALVNLSDGSLDPSWTPDVDGSFYGPWDLLVDENHLYVGGAFKTVAGLPRLNFTRFTFTT